MGCDIHLHIEIKVHGKWEHYRHQAVPRNYALFGLMGGVRGDGRAIAENRGIPADATVVTKFNYTYWGMDGHHPNWLDSKEVATLVDRGDSELGLTCKIMGSGRWWETDYFGYLFGNTFAGWTLYPEDNGQYRELGLEDFRFVFWFDN